MNIQRKLILPYTQEALYSLIANIEAYPTFLSVCTHAKILERTSEFLRAELTISYGPFKEKFVSKVYLAPFDSIEAIGETGSFRHLRVTWSLQSLNAQETGVDFFLDIEFKSKILERMVGKMTHRVNLSVLRKIFENPLSP